MVQWNTVPAVSPTWCLQRLHWWTARPLSAAQRPWPQAGQAQPLPQRNWNSAARHAASVPNRLPELRLAQPLHPPPQPDFRAHPIAPQPPKPVRTLARSRLGVTDNQEELYREMVCLSDVPEGMSGFDFLCEVFLPLGFDLSCPFFSNWSPPADGPLPFRPGIQHSYLRRHSGLF